MMNRRRREKSLKRMRMIQGMTIMGCGSFLGRNSNFGGLVITCPFGD
jgi:hypothetical protein